jgi:hypothetical protein
MKARIDLYDHLIQLGSAIEDDFSMVSNVQIFDDKLDSEAVVSVTIRYD